MNSGTKHLTSLWQSLLQRLASVQSGEGRAVFWSFLYFFSLLSSYYVLRPIRDEMGIVAGIDQLQWLFTGTFIAMLLVVPLFGFITSRLQRRQFLPYVYLFFIFNLILFYLIFESAESLTNVARVFFIWLSVFNLFVVSVFWSFMADLYRNEQAKRLFGLIASGGTIGAMTGPLLTATLVQQLGTSQMMLISAGLLCLSILCINRLIRWQATNDDREEQNDRSSERVEKPIGGSIWDGILLVLRSPYLMGICVLMLLFTLLSTFLYFQQAQIIKLAVADSEARTALFATIDLSVNALTLLIQTLITARLIKGLGLAMVLALIPLLLCLGFVLLALFPALPVLVAVQVLRRAGNYAVMRPSREMLYVVLRRDEKYKAKNFIDTVVYRGGDAVSSWVYTGFRTLGMSLSTIACIAAPIALIWAWVAYRLGQQQNRIATQTNSQNGDE
ncbi:MAG: MFS transporter [Candidatus Thiodiazotropha taylori]|nr:MFS transporter [Candidatus Thiodiazotropha taylori]MCG8108786.1 MFS transporter [Candidatus Thiodiazotropha taylori]MCG8109457.1 MFS transporter [Candidatus Thiodiazotropha taylori]MCW4281122.1 MFS transporter [Candidatus Thiodiazotropha taylori]MCW4281798.1 MFS transporter [Candidatus Thiodiazotropha taylori]